VRAGPTPYFGGLHPSIRSRIKPNEQEKENGELKRLVAEVFLEKQILKDIVEGNF
jgi:hypothetical protein